MRELAAKAVQHERELRAVYDAHERELRLAAEVAVEKARNIQFDEYERRLEDMNRFREQLEHQATTFVTIDRFERDHKALEAAVKAQHSESEVKRSSDHDLLAKLLTQVGTLRGVAVFVGLPGILAFIWAIVAAVANKTVTGPGGLLP